MPAFRRVEDRRAGPLALGILVPPGQRTVVILRPRFVRWDLLALLSSQTDATWAFADFTRDEAAGIARQVQQALEQGPCAQPVLLPGPETGFFVAWQGAGFRWIACLRRPGKAYEPAFFATQQEATAAATAIARFLLPDDGARQELYFNTQNFSR
jgi:hypothetical protein